MLAARVKAWKAGPILEEMQVPTPVAGEALVEVVAAPCVHFDLSVMSGEFFANPKLPFTPGHEGAGRVVESEAHAAGTPVRLRPGAIGLTRDGSWAEQVVVPDDDLEPLPAETDLVVAAACQSPCATAHAALRLVGGFEPGQKVAVTGGTGAVGSVTAQLALRWGASQVVAFHRDPNQSHLISEGVESVVWDDGDCLAPFTDLEGFDLVVDVLGGEMLAMLATRATKTGGTVAVVGYAASEELTISVPELIHANVNLKPVNLVRLAAEVPPAAELLAEVERGEVDVRVTAMKLSELDDALAMLRQGTAGARIVLTP